MSLLHLNPPLYDIEKSYLQNLHDGPLFHGEIPKRVRSKKPLDLLGKKIASPLGVASGPLLDSKWVLLAARLGFDVLVYKTIRSYFSPSHPVPNMLHLSPRLAEIMEVQDEPSFQMSSLTVTNSFGNPSMSPDYLRDDIAKARKGLDADQMLIVSVYGCTDEEYRAAIALAKEAGAEAIELNYSCPNIAGKAQYEDPSEIARLTPLLVKAAHPLPVIIKAGYIEEPLLKDVLVATAKSGAHGFSAINTLKRKVVKKDGSPALGPNRPFSGICGAPIRPYALDMMKRAFSINREEKLGLTLMGVGGIVDSTHFDDFLNSGCQIALSASGMMWDPLIAMRWHSARNNR